jgi:hypothetical protein
LSNIRIAIRLSKAASTSAPLKKSTISRSYEPLSAQTHPTLHHQSSGAGLKIEDVLNPSRLALDLVLDHMAAFRASVGSKFGKWFQIRCSPFKRHGCSALWAVFLAAFLIEHRVLPSSRNRRLMTLYSECTPFLDVSAKLIFGMLPLMPDTCLSDSYFLQNERPDQRLPNINPVTSG